MKMIHSMVRVRHLDKSLEFYRKALGLEVAERLDFDDFTLVYLRSAESDFELELTWNKNQEQNYDLGGGYGHLACSTDDLDAAHRRMQEAGIGPADIKEFFRDGVLLARFFFIQDPDGYKIEVLQRHGRYL
ncbi:MAG: VOC family protein [Gammaproteobacteria bacterium]|nr:VOC family protein [Gammaproteobacteria bacterium]MDD9799824.1 VOC family protein [Gammaproteobacteria bacterium]MDD9814455.1 VOC family protein [Gammaproteobacteria bacterium]MDD9851344.1 VOC family protein [Gammaproteobacteria bacterium]MDD9871449.1 VOC family protein [Gammaproteobacteria bacterium]